LSLELILSPLNAVYTLHPSFLIKKATAACRQILCQLLRIEGVVWSA
jgi:hypothetical protein